MRFKKNKNRIKPHLPTNEELIVKNYLDNNLIKYIPEYRLDKLKGDTKSYRLVDFYLPKLDVYVEYFGMYNSTKGIRAEYDKKADVYIKKNEMATVILYPHELGFIDFAFHKKILKVLRIPKYKSNLKMFKYKFARYLTIGKGYFFFLSLISLILTDEISKIDDSPKDFDLIFGFGFAVSIALLFQFFWRLTLVFFYDE